MKSVEADIVIVGSGAGGGTVAARLAPLVAKGKRVILLEQGPRFDYRRFNGHELEMSRMLYREGGGFMVADGTVSLAFVEGYGGSTVVYTGTSLEPPAHIIERWNLPGLSPDELVRRAKCYARDNGVHSLPAAEINENNRLFVAGCRELGWKATQFAVNTRGCRGSGLCNLGCPNNAKQGTHVVQLPRAESQGVEVITRARVMRLRGRRLEVEVRLNPDGTPSEWEPGNYEVRAGRVVLAGGVVGSTTLLLRSGFDRTLPAVGRYFTCQPAHILVAEHPHPIQNAVGHPKSFLWDEQIEGDHFFLETCMYPPFITAKNMTGFGRDHERFLRRFDHLQMILVLACDEALPSQRIVLDRRGNPQVRYQLDPRTIRALVSGTRAAAKIFFAAGAIRVHAPSARPTRLEANERDRIETRIRSEYFLPGTVSVSAAHLMGGCRMGRSTTDSVTNIDGQVHGYPWLHVADASLFPTALEANPYLTIMALADRVADAVLDKEHA